MTLSCLYILQRLIPSSPFIKIIWISLLLLISIPIFSQVLNGDNYIYEHRLKEIYMTTDLDDGENEPSFVFAFADDDNGVSDNILNLFTTDAIIPYDICEWWNEDTPSGRVFNPTKRIDFHSNNTSGLYDYTMGSWEWQGGGDRCRYNSGDTGGGGIFGLRSVNSGNPIQVHSHFFNWDNSDVDGSYAYVDYAWRYKKGDDKINALDFGTLNTNTTVSHYNANRSAPSGGWNSTIGYSSNYTSSMTLGNNAPDVWYKFAVPDNGKSITIALNNTSGLRLFLLRSDDVLLTWTNTSITRNLCGGTYYLVVEGQTSTSTNNFTVSVQSENFFITPGTIAASNDTACEGAPIEQINNVIWANALEENPTYKWYKAENISDPVNNDWVLIAGANSSFLPQSMTGLMPDTAPGNDFVKFQRRAFACGSNNNQVSSNIVTINAIPSSVDAGTIELRLNCNGAVPGEKGPYTIPEDVDPGCFGSATMDVITYDDPTGAPGPLTNQWQIDGPTPDNIWTDVGTNSTTWDANETHFSQEGTYLVRRKVTNGCGQIAFSDTITVHTLPQDGIISGTITSPSGSKVPQVVVTGVRTTMVQGGDLVTDTYVDTSNLNGFYELSGIYYGPGNGSEFTVTASRVDTVITTNPPDTMVIVHVFDPPDYSGANAVELKEASRTKININFTDLTSFSFAGMVVQDYEGTLCGLFGVEILRDNVVQDTTDVNGMYNINIPNVGTYTIKARYKDHTFDTIYTNVYIDQNKVNQDFKSLNMHRVYGSLTDGCGVIGGTSGQINGEAILTFTDTTNCIVKRDTTVGGQYDLMLPAKPYSVSFDHDDQVIDLFFAAARKIDLSERDTMLNWKFSAQPVITITGLPSNAPCAAPYNVPILEQARTYPAAIEIFEGTVGGCKVDTGFMLITDAISEKDSTLQFGNGAAVYKLFPKSPNLSPDHLKNISIAATDKFGQQSEAFLMDAVVTGVRAREQTFTTVTPEIPYMIIRDPPGDASFSQVTQGKTIETATSFYSSDAKNVNIWNEVKLGTQFEAGFIGFDVETEIWGQVGTSLEIGATSTSNTEAIMSITTTETFSTSDNPEITGSEGDVFVGFAMNLLYAKADILKFNENTCQPKLDVDLIMKNDGFKTKFIYTEQYIRDEIIPSLRQLAEFPIHQDSVTFYLDQVKVWEQTLLRNEELKKGAVFLENISFSNNAKYTNTTEINNTETLSLEFLTEINTELALEAGVEVAGNGASGGVTAMFKVELGKSKTNTTTQSLITEFELFDNTEGDGFTVDVLHDPVYKTPVFKTVAGQSSCPYEEGTLRRQVPALSVVNPIVTNVPLGGVANFQFELKNESESEDTMTYVFKLNQASNPFGAQVTIGGVPAPPGGIGYEIPYLETQNVAVDVRFGQPGTYTYEALEFELNSDCDEDVSTSTSIAVFWQSPCSEIGLFAPDPDAATPQTGWRITSNTPNRELDVHIKDYEETDLDQIIVEYAPVGGNTWTTLKVLTVADIVPNDPDGANLGMITPVNFGNVPDGAYNIRLQLICSGNRLFTRRAIGLIDTKAPSVLGIPSPKDDIYHEAANDIIAVTFDENIDCSMVSVLLTRLDNDNEPIPTLQPACTDRSVEITPVGSLAVPGAYRVSLIGIKDAYGNETPQVNWLFITPGYQVEDSCDPLLLSNNNVNQDRISVAIYRAMEITTDGTVQGFATTTFKAEMGISMNNGFEVQSGGNMVAEIEVCPE